MRNLSVAKYSKSNHTDSNTKKSDWIERLIVALAIFRKGNNNMVTYPIFFFLQNKKEPVFLQTL